MKYKLQVETHLDYANKEKGWKAFEYGDTLQVICVQDSIAVVILEETRTQKDLTRYHIPIATLNFVGEKIDKVE
jgi:hypothetical protein